MSDATGTGRAGKSKGGASRGFGQGRTSLITYVMGGYPDRAASLEALRTVARAGADVIELGVPYGDPLADGPVIASAAKAALEQAGGFGLAQTIELARDFLAGAHSSDTPEDAAVPVVLMTYLNPMLRMGLPRVARLAREAGVAGFIVPDMLPGTPMADRWLAEAEEGGLDTIFLVAPTSTVDRLSVAAGSSTGFVYCVSSVGVTGERASLPDGLADLVARVRAAAGSTPVAVGFGVGTPEQAAAVGGVADGVIVGSAIVRRQRDPRELETFVAGLRSALDAGGR